MTQPRFSVTTCATVAIHTTTHSPWSFVGVTTDKQYDTISRENGAGGVL